MKRKIRKLFGAFVLVSYIIIYALLVMKLAAATLPSIGGWGQLGFYVVFGLVWVIPAAAIIYWMQKPDLRDS